MGHFKDIFTETADELHFVASKGDNGDIAKVTAYLDGTANSTFGVLSPAFESNLDMDVDGFREAWGEILREVEGASSDG
jgi:hypothetical protein